MAFVNMIFHLGINQHLEQNIKAADYERRVQTRSQSLDVLEINLPKKLWCFLFVQYAGDAQNLHHHIPS
jgi:hypothetical protein